jgi:hypothetical protein
MLASSRGATWSGLLAWAVAGASCAPLNGVDVPVMQRAVRSCSYEVNVTRAQPLELNVLARCQGVAVRGLEAEDSSVAARIHHVQSNVGRVARQGHAFVLPRGVPDVEFRYQVNLEPPPTRPDLDAPLRSGRSVLASASSFLLYPLPLYLGIETRVVFRAAPEVTVTSGLARQGGVFRLQAH